MNTLFFRPHAGRSLMIIPDTLAHLNGHAIITHTYSIFRDTGDGSPRLARSKENTLHLEKINDPDYYGYITFELPEKLFSYTADGPLELEPGEAQQIIEFLSDFRSNPALWKNAGS